MSIHRDADFREIPLNIAVVIANIGGNVIDRLRQDLVVITIRIKAALRVHRVFEIVFRGEIIEVIFALTRFYPPRHIIVYPKKIDIRAEDQRRVVFAGRRQAVVGGKDLAQRFGEFMFYQRVKEAAVKKQVGIPGGFFIRVAVGEGIARGQVEHHADLARQRQFTISRYRFGVRQHNVKRHLRRQPAIFLTWIVEVVQVASLNRHNRLVEGYPVFNLMAKQAKGGAGKAGKQLGYVRRFKAAVLFLQRFRHIKVVEIDHRLNAVGDHLIQIGVIKTHRVRVRRAGFQISDQS